MEKYTKIIKFSIIILVIVVIIFLVILIINKNSQKNEAIRDYEAEDEIGIEKNENISYVDSPTMFYTVQNIIQKYLSYVHLDYDKTEEEDIQIKVGTLAQLYGITNEKEKREAIFATLDTDYINKNKITVNNLSNYIEIDRSEVKNCKVIEMKVIKNDQFQVYGVHVKVDKKDEYYKVMLDEYNSTWKIQPITNCNNINEIQLNINDDISQIENNKVNVYSYVRVNDGEMAEKYFKEYQQLMLNDYDTAYNKFSEEYRNKRFGNVENFKKYIEKNKQEIGKLYITKYLTTENGKNLDYVCKDQYGNIYTFETKGVMNYTVKLDNYTIETDKFKNTYKDAKDEDKVAMNIDKWVSMLNNRDYTAAYKVLDETFRNENFGSEENFESYMREQYPLHYVVHQEEIKKESNAYVRKVVLVDSTGETNFQNENNIIMQLKEGTEFVMSFYVRRH